MRKIIIVTLSIILLTVILLFFAGKKEKIFYTEGIISPTVKISSNGKYIAFIEISLGNAPKLVFLELINKRNAEINTNGFTGSFAWSNESDNIIYAARTIDFKYCLKKYNVTTGTETIITKYFDNMLFLPNEILNLKTIVILEYLNTYHELDGKKWFDNILWYLNNEGKYIEIAKGIISPIYYINNNKVYYAAGNIINNKLIWSLYIKDVLSGENIKVSDNIADYIVKRDCLYYFRTESNVTSVDKISLKNMEKTSIGKFNKIKLPAMSEDCSKLCYRRDKNILVMNLADLQEKKLVDTKEAALQLLWVLKDKYILYITPHSIISINIK